MFLHHLLVVDRHEKSFWCLGAHLLILFAHYFASHANANNDQADISFRVHFVIFELLEIFKKLFSRVLLLLLIYNTNDVFNGTLETLSFNFYLSFSDCCYGLFVSLLNSFEQWALAFRICCMLLINSFPKIGFIISK